MTRQPCCICGVPKARAHHEDYDEPLKVTWLCQKHHAERHQELGDYTPGRRPQGFTAKTVMLPPELWDRLERFMVEEHLSSVAEALRVLLWRALPDESPKPVPAPRKGRRSGE